MDDLWGYENMKAKMTKRGRDHTLESSTEPFPDHS